MPNYNKDKYIRVAIDSVINQKYKNWKLLVIDGNSTDNSVEILKDYEIRHDNIKVIYLPKRKNVSFARNLGIRLSTGKYISFLDSDDYWSNDKLNEQIDYMENNNYKFTYTDYKPFITKNNNKTFKKEVIAPSSFTCYQFINNTSIATSSVIINKSIIGTIKCPNVDILEDYPFKYKILEKGFIANKFNSVSMFYRISKDSLQSNKFRNIYWLWKINKKYIRLSFLRNFISILMISLNSIKKYGFK